MNAHSWRAAWTPAKVGALSPQGRVRLLAQSFSGLRFTTTMFPMLGAGLTAFYSLTQPPTAMLVWLVFYVLFTTVVWWRLRVFKADCTTQPPQAVVERWMPQVQVLAMVHGLCMTTSLWVSNPHVSVEYGLTLYVALAVASMANASSHLAPSISVFVPFWLAGWNLVVVSTAFSASPYKAWQLPLLVLFSVALYRQALATQRFIVGHLELEEHSQMLAQRYQSAQADAEAALREKNRFLTTASHDLRQPIHAMSMLVEAALRRNRDPMLVSVLRDLRHSMQSTSALFNALLDLSRFEAGVLPAAPQWMRLDTLMREMHTLFGEQARSRGLALRLHLPPVAAHVMADPALLRQSISNLVHNALRYTRRGGVLMALRRRGPEWRVEVWDTGMGVGSDEEKRIFSPYYRDPKALLVDSAGHGLGLAVVARCAELMHATLGLRSRKGQGSLFWLGLAAMPMPSALFMPVQSQPDVVETPLLRGCCLVVEDDPQVVIAWQALLKSWGVSACFAADGRQIMDLLDGGLLPDAVFCDQHLRSGESGFDLLRAVLARCPTASGAMVSGEFNAPALAQAEAEGYLVLSKPVDPQVLWALLQTWCEPQTLASFPAASQRATTTVG